MELREIEFIYDEFVHSFTRKIINIWGRNFHEPKKICFHLIDDGFATEFPRFVFIARHYPGTIYGKICTALQEAYGSIRWSDDSPVALAKYRRVVDLLEFL